MRSRTATAQAATMGGHRRGSAQHADPVPGILVEERISRRAKGRRQGSLYILVEMAGEFEGNDAVAGHLARVISDVYFGERRSVTAGLQEAIREVNTLLHEQNRNVLAGERLTAGVSCVLLRDEDLFIAQAGPAAIYMAHEAQVTRFPELSPWLDNIPMEAVDTAPLGERREVHVDLFHSQVADGDTVLLVNSEVARRASPRVWRGILAAASMDGVLEALVAVAHGSDLSALALRTGEQPGHQAVVQKASQQTEQPAAAHPPPQKSDAAVAAVPALAAAIPVQETAQEVVAPHRQRVDPVTGRRMRAMGRGLVAIGAALAVLLRRMMPGSPSRVDGARPAEIPVGEGAAPSPREDAAPPDVAPAKGAAPRKESAQPVAPTRKRQPGKQPGRDRAPQLDAAPRADTAGVQVRGAALQKLLLAVAILIPLLAAALVVYNLIQWDQKQDAAADDLWLTAESLWIQAGATGDPAKVRALLKDAQTALDQLLAQEPGRADALQLQQQIQERLDANNQVQRIPWEGLLVTYPSGAGMSRVVVEGVHVFVMDRTSGKVYHHQMDQFQQAVEPSTRDTVLVQKGDQVGDRLVGDLIDMAWMPAGNGRPKAGLVILDSEGSLLQYDPGTKDLVALRTAARDKWQLPQLMGSHSGRFYLLDAKANQIWRYNPTADGYSTAPVEWLQTAIDLAGVRDMAIGDSIFLLYADGTIRKLTNGEPDTFDIFDWDTPPKGPTAIFTRQPTQTQWLYVADPGNYRIVQSSTEGKFERQFRLADSQEAGSGGALAGVTSLFVDEIGGRAYFLSGNELHLIMLPE